MHYYYYRVPYDGEQINLVAFAILVQKVICTWEVGINVVLFHVIFHYHDLVDAYVYVANTSDFVDEQN